MHYFLYPTKDSFISNNPSFTFKNMGLDEILEVEKRTYPVAYQSTASGQYEPAFGAKDTSLSRALLHFNLLEISQSIAAGNIISPKFYLSLKVAEATEIPTSYTLAAYPLAKHWEMGTGHKYDGSGVSNGASWKFSDAGSIKWWSSESLSDLTGGGLWYVNSSSLGSGSGYAQLPHVSPNPYDPFPFCSGSFPPTSSAIQQVTGAFACSQSFDCQSSDVYMDVTTIVNAWLSNTIPNYGLIVLHSGESDNVDYGKLRFFSKETNTIYSPHLDVAWQDAVFSVSASLSSSFDPLDIQDAVVSIKNMAPVYKHGSIVRFGVVGRKRYPIKTFTNKLSDYLEPYYLPFDSFYTIRDADSEETIIPYDIFTRISFDYSGNYFFLDTTGLPQERHFRIEIRSEQSGSINTFDIPTTFKITR